MVAALATDAESCSGHECAYSLQYQKNREGIGVEIDSTSKRGHARVCPKSALMKSNIIFVTSHPMSVVAFILPHIRVLKSSMSVEVIANSNERALLQQRGLDIPVDHVKILRPIAPWSDIRALWVLYLRFKKVRPSAVHTITPKAGLLGMMGAWLACVPVRVHSFTGQVWLTRTGLLRWLLKLTDKLIAAMATDVLVDSPSQRDFLIKQGIVTAEGSIVLGAGSICGVNLKRFSPNEFVRKIVRGEMRTPSDAVVCLYLGRLNRDKGVLDLARAFAQLADKNSEAELWLVGPDEGDYFKQIQALLGDATCKVKRWEYTASPERFMQAADLFCLPSYREGFGSTVIEAAACGLPSLVSRIYGLADAVVEGKTGWMHEAGNIQDLTQQLDRLLSDPIELASKGVAARRNVAMHFTEKKVTDAMLDFYKKRLL